MKYFMEKIIIVVVVCILSLIETYAAEAFRCEEDPVFCTIGNFLEDYVYKVPDAFLEREGLEKDQTKWIDAEQERYYSDQLGSAGYSLIHAGSGGSAGNTGVGVGKFGLKVLAMGVLGDDLIASEFRRSSNQNEIELTEISAINPQLGTGVCYVLVTPDGKRTMLTNLGVSKKIVVSDEHIEKAARARYLLVEGFSFEPEETHSSIRRVAQRTKENNNSVVLTLSAEFCVANHKEDMLTFIEDYVDIVLGNEGEALLLTGACSAKCAAYILQNMGKRGAITCGSEGAYVFDKDSIYFIESPTVGEVVDTTGAGDQFAAGLIYGLNQGMSLDKAGQIAAFCAGDVIQDWGAHPHSSELKMLVEAGTPYLNISVIPVDGECGDSALTERENLPFEILREGNVG